ncbi:germination protein YpeB [Paenibacillus baekrokdamisoli]|uniref:Germination protein YpeB n=1 Tax=Paenibacillus baekrokdamisoli TaxID=1712516 RepID=A0A3G9IRU7_9BACL|nr:germination protein YpeB [Paenibacillus baekrokdamisoli]MBB3069624.1 spore germination protein [Paenibacillus baekrokdamisoli]BBH21022.1 germination protein YpeB [Paenibacillus baekrokdamisoli]
MYRRLSAVLFPVMSLFFIGSIYWGYQEHQEKNSILIKAENQYQRAFHDLSYHVEQVHRELGNTLAVNSTSQGIHRKGLVNVWRLTSQAQSEINQLPLTLLPFNRTEDFLSRIANFSYKTSVRDLTKQPLSKDEFKMLKTLYANSEQISNDLLHVQEKVITKNLRWMDVETAIATEKSTLDNTIIDGFKTVDKKVSEYPEINWGPSVSSMYQKRTIKMLGGEMKSPEDIKKMAAEFLKLSDTSGIKVVENGKGTEHTSYSVTVSKGKPEDTIHLDYTQKGGQLIWFMNSRKVGKETLKTNDAEQKAIAFLSKHGYEGMKAINYDKYDSVAVFTCVGTQNGVLIYPEKLTVKIALDNGEAVGLQANDYIYEHHKRTLPQPKVKSADARAVLNPDFKTKSVRMALIKNDLGNEVLCYEFVGHINDGMYRIYINADTGLEEAIEQMPK